MIMALLLLTGCANKVAEDDIVGKTYRYEHGGFQGAGDFSIAIHEDGTFSYSEGILCGYLVLNGEWSLDDGIVCLAEDGEYGMPRVNYFRADKQKLEFISENSNNFGSIKVKDGDMFLAD